MGIFTPHSAQYLTGRLFDKYPTLPLKEAGRAFRYRHGGGRGAIERVGTGFEYGARQMTVTTPCALDWKEKKYVLADGELWRISSFSHRIIGTAAPSMLKSGNREYSLELVRVDNASEVSR